MWIFIFFASSVFWITVTSQELLNFTERDSKFLRDEPLLLIRPVSDETIANEWIPKIPDQTPSAQSRNGNGFYLLRDKGGNNEHYPVRQFVSHFATIVNHQNFPPSRFGDFPPERFRTKSSASHNDNTRSASYKPTYIYALKPPISSGGSSSSSFQESHGLKNWFTHEPPQRPKVNHPFKPFRASQPLPLEEDLDNYGHRTSIKTGNDDILFQKSIEPTIEELANHYLNKYNSHAPVNKSPLVSSYSIKDESLLKVPNNKHRHKDILAPPPAFFSSSYYAKDGFKKNVRKGTTPPPITLYVTRPNSQISPGLLVDSESSLSLSKPQITSLRGNNRDLIKMPIFTLIDYDKLYAKTDELTRHHSTNKMKEYVAPNTNIGSIPDNNKNVDADPSDDRDFFQNKTFVDFNRAILQATPNLVTAGSELSIQKIFPEINVDQSTTEAFKPTTILTPTENDDEKEENRFTNLDESTEIVNLNFLKMNISVDGMIGVTTTPSTLAARRTTANSTTTSSQIYKRKISATSEVCEKACVRNIINQDYNPICGSDNRTYANKGKFRCSSICGQQKKLSIVHTGICVQAETKRSLK